MVEHMIEGPFTTQEALRAGMTAHQLRAKRWRAPFRGVHEAADDAATLLTRCQALSLVLPPGAVFGGITVAELRGWWLPRHAELLPIHVVVPPGRFIERPGVRCVRQAIDERHVVDHEGLRVTSGLRTLRDLAADWSLIDTVVMADAALRFGDCGEAEWVSAAGARQHRGARTLRRAVDLTDPRSESPMETVLRLMFVVPGLPAPTPQAVIRDSCGGWLAEVDLLGADGKSVFEFDGADHDEPARRASDRARWRMLRREGYEVFPYVARDLFFGAAYVLADYQGVLGIPDDPRYLERWLLEWRLSSYYRGRHADRSTSAGLRRS